MSELQAGNFGPRIIVPGALPGSQQEAPAPALRSTNALVLILSAIVMLGICAVGTACVLLFAGLMGRVQAEKAPIETVLHQAMTAGKARDARALFALESIAAQDAQPFSEIEKFVRGSGYTLFSGYRELAVTDFNLTWSSVAYAEVTGLIEYDDGYTGRFDAVLVQEGGVWKIESIDIVVPAGKFDAAH